MARLTDLMQWITNIAIFKLTTTGSAMRIGIGFKPSFVLIFNATNPSLHIWFPSMGAAYVLNIFNHADTQFGLVTSGGISQSDGEVGGADGTNDFYIKGSTGVATALASGADIPEGMEIGTNAVLNTASDVLHVFAVRL